MQILTFSSMMFLYDIGCVMVLFCLVLSGPRGRKNVVSCVTVTDSPMSDTEMRSVDVHSVLGKGLTPLGFTPIKDEPVSSSSDYGKSCYMSVSPAPESQPLAPNLLGHLPKTEPRENIPEAMETKPSSKPSPPRHGSKLQLLAVDTGINPANLQPNN